MYGSDVRELPQHLAASPAFAAVSGIKRLLPRLVRKQPMLLSGEMPGWRLLPICFADHHAISVSAAHPQAKLLKDPGTASSAAWFLAVLAVHPPTAKAIIATEGTLQLLVDMLQPVRAASEGECWCGRLRW